MEVLETLLVIILGVVISSFISILIATIYLHTEAYIEGNAWYFADLKKHNWFTKAGRALRKQERLERKAKRNNFKQKIQEELKGE